MKVPRLIPQQNIKNAPSPQAWAPGPEAFGGNIGAALSQSGRELTAHAEEMQREKDAIKGLDLTVKAQQRINNILYGEDGLMRAQGLNADGISNRFVEIYDEVIQEILEESENENQKMIVTQSMLRHMPGYQSQLAKHEAAELQNAKMASLQATLDSQVKIAVDARGDPETLAAVTEDVERTVAAMAGHLGEEAVLKMVDDTMSKVHSNVISNLLVDDLAGAKEYFEKYRDELDPGSRTKIEELIKNKEDVIENQALSEEIYARFGIDDEAGALKYIRENYEGEKEDKLLSRTQGMYVDARRIRAQREQQSYDWMYSVVGSAQTYTEALNAIDDSNLKEQHKRTLRNYAKDRFNVSEGRTPKTSPETASRLQELKNNYTLFEEYPTWETFFAEFGDSLSYTDQDRYRRMYEDIRNGMASTVVYRTQEVLDTKIQKADIKDPVVISKIHQSANQYLRAASEKKGAPLTPVEEAEIIDSLFEDVTLERRTGLFDLDILARDDRGMRWQLPPGYEYNDTLGIPIKCIPEEGLCYDIDGKPVAIIASDEEENEMQ